MTGHDIPANLREILLDRIAAFFALLAESKNTLRRRISKALRGFETLGEQQLEPGVADVKEGSMIGTAVDSKCARFLQGPNQWPAEGQVDGFESTYMEYFQKMRDLSTHVPPHGAESQLGRIILRQVRFGTRLWVIPVSPNKKHF
jgi:isopenicillin N synthase-like dioxygenase